MINETIGCFEEKNENKFLVLDDVDENKKVSKKYEEVWEGVKKEIEMIKLVQKCYSMKKFMLQKELMQVKQVNQKNVNFVTIDFLKM